MAEYGLGNFVYELEVSDGNANFKFRDPEDASNTAEVSVHQSDFPEGINQADSRQVADLAFAQCSKGLK
jgi:glutamine cyclotransferase